MVAESIGIDDALAQQWYQVVGDAVACRRPGVGDAASYKPAVVRVVGNYAGIQESTDLIEEGSKIAI
jgi:hypothetical protein